MKTKALAIALLLSPLALAACGGGGGSVSNGPIIQNPPVVTPPTDGGNGGGNGNDDGGTPPVVTPPVVNPPVVTPKPQPGPKSDSLADLMDFALKGVKHTNTRGAVLHTHEYTVDGAERRVVLAGDAKSGLLTVDNGGRDIRHTLIGADANGANTFKGNYNGEAVGVVTMANGQSFRAEGTTAISVSGVTGEWLAGADLWNAEQATTAKDVNGIYVGFDNGKINGNTMTFDAANSSITVLNANGSLQTSDTATMKVIADATGTQIQGLVNANNAGGIKIDAGFAGATRK